MTRNAKQVARWNPRNRLVPVAIAAILVATFAATGMMRAPVAAGGVPGAHSAVRATSQITVDPSDWPTYGHDPNRSFTGATSLSVSSVTMLVPAWFFPTGDAITAQPVVVGNSVYVGSWDGYFYDVDRATGALRWKYRLTEQPAVNPSPGNPSPRDPTSDGGLVTDTAWFQPADASHPALVIFGGGYTLYALDADTGSLYWSHADAGLPEAPPSPSTDSTRIFSSPLVVGNQVIIGVSSDGGSGHRGYVVSHNINNGSVVWRFETDVDASGNVLDNGCGGVWSSPSLDPVRKLVFVGVADCHSQGIAPYSERVLALHALSGSLAWVFTPPRLVGIPDGTDPACDFDFGASVNLGSPDPVSGAPSFLGIGGKDGTYYRLEPATGALIWARNVVFGGLAGGFLGTTAYDGHQVYGATAIGDIGSSSGTCEPGNTADTPVQEPSIHSLTVGGSIVWEKQGAQSLGPTTVAGGMTFAGYAFAPEVQVRDASNGALLAQLVVASDCYCGVSVAGNAVFFGTGSPQQGAGDGLYAFTPLGVEPGR